MAGMAFFLLCILQLLLGILLLNKDNPCDMWLLLFTFLIASLYAALAVKNL